MEARTSVVVVAAAIGVVAIGLLLMRQSVVPEQPVSTLRQELGAAPRRAAVPEVEGPESDVSRSIITGSDVQKSRAMLVREVSSVPPTARAGHSTGRPEDQRPATLQTVEERRAFVDVLMKARMEQCPPYVLAQELSDKARSEFRRDLSAEESREAENLVAELFRIELTFRLALQSAVEQHVLSGAPADIERAPLGEKGYFWRLARGLTNAESSLFGDAQSLDVRVWLSYTNYPILGEARRARTQVQRQLARFLQQ